MIVPINLSVKGTECLKQRNIVYIGRAMPGIPGSPLANPYRIGGSVTREAAITQYEIYLWKLVAEKPNSPQVKELVRILNLEDEYGECLLATWVNPPNHARVIIDCARYVEKNA